MPTGPAPGPGTPPQLLQPRVVTSGRLIVGRHGVGEGPKCCLDRFQQAGTPTAHRQRPDTRQQFPDAERALRQSEASQASQASTCSSDCCRGLTDERAQRLAEEEGEAAPWIDPAEAPPITEDPKDDHLFALPRSCQAALPVAAHASRQNLFRWIAGVQERGLAGIAELEQALGRRHNQVGYGFGGWMRASGPG